MGVESQYERKLSTRYSDAYGVAGTTVLIGTVVKALGIVVAFVLSGGALLLCSVPPFRDQAVGVAAVGLTAATLAGAHLYVMGVLIGAQGQMLRATMDTAVNSSPHLDDFHKALIMGLVRLQTATGATGVVGIVLDKQIVVSVRPDGPASRAGIRPGDRIAEVDGRSLTGENSHDVSLLSGEPGTTARISLYRDGQAVVLSVYRTVIAAR